MRSSTRFWHRIRLSRGSFDRSVSARSRSGWGWRPPLPKPPLGDDDEIEILHVAGERDGWERKGTEQVVTAFAALAPDPALTFRVTAVDPLPEAWGASLHAAGVQLQEGHLPAARLAARLRGARATVQPSLWEGIGIPILESLAEGTPVVTTDGPPMNEYVRHKAEGLLVPTTPTPMPGLAVPRLEFSVESLVETIQLLTDRDLLRHLEQKALQGGASRIDPERACRDLAAGIHELVAAGAEQR